jgi:hypothetical protein
MSDTLNTNPQNPKYAVTPSGPDGNNPATAGPGPTHVHSETSENKGKKLNPSAPNDVNITPKTDYAQ